MLQIAQTGSIILFSLVFVFHILILFKVIPYNMVWGGRLKTNAAMYRFETISLLLNAVFLIIVLIRSGYINIQVNNMVLTILCWIMAVLFLINTVGNIFSKNKWEKVIFTPLTVLLTTFSIVMAIN